MQQVDFMKFVDNFSKIKHIKSKLIFGNPELCPNPYISIVIPTYNRPNTLIIALDSALNQIEPSCNYEVIVVDNEFSNYKTSRTEDLLKKNNNPRLLYYQNAEIYGMVNNWNRCIQLARANWVAFLHDDDILLPDYINRILRLLSHKENIAGIMALFQSFNNDDDIKQSTFRHNNSFKSKLYNNLSYNKLMRLRQKDSNVMLSDIYGAPSCGSIFRKDCLIESGGFNDSFYPSFDWFFLYKYCGKYNLYRSMERLGYYRAYDNTSSLEKTKVGFFRDALLFADYVAKNTQIGRVMNYIFSNEQNNRILSAPFSDFVGKTISEYFIPSEIRKRCLRGFFYPLLLKVYWNQKTLFFLLFG